MVLSSKYPPADRGRIVIWGFLASSPFGGMTWQVLHHLAGFRRLGFDVWYVEDSDKPVHKPTTWWPTSDYTENIEYLAHYMDYIGLGVSSLNFMGEQIFVQKGPSVFSIEWYYLI